MDYTIVGGGIAAFAALKAIRQLDPRTRVTVVSEEEHCFYYRPMTPLMVKGDRERDELLSAAAIPEFHHLHDRAVGLDPAARTLTLRQGGSLGFKRLLIATGSTPVIPEIPGVRQANIYYLRTLADATALREAGKGAKRAVVLGGGLVGIKQAVALRHLGLEVTVVEQAEQILQPRLDREGAEIVAARLQATGIRLRTGESLAEIGPQGREVRLASGETMATDLVCIAVGVKPNLAWLAGSGLTIDRALVVDERMETSGAGIHAAGDVVQTTDLVTGRIMVSGLWANAVEMGRIAGINMAGGRMKHGGSLEIMNATEIERLPFISVGDIMAEGNGHEVFRQRHGDRYRKLVFKGDRLVGAVFLGEVTNAGVYTALIRSGRPLGASKEKAIRSTLTYADCCLRGTL